MKLEIWEEDVLVEPTLYVRLRREGNEILVYLADKNGDPVSFGGLLSIQPGRSIDRLRAVSSDHGFPLNKEGQVTVIGWSEG